jgi:hypothetical protein
MSGIFAGLLAGGGASGDASWSYVSMLLSTTSLSNANNNLFVDSSGAFNPISRTGNTTQGSFTPYGPLWSNFFDGSGDYFTVPYTTANFDWYTGGVDFTIEYWFFANSLTGTSYVDGGVTKSTLVGNRDATGTTDYWSFGPNAGGTVTFYYFNGSPIAVNSTATINANSWNHIAMTKTSSGITIFVNGVAQTTTAISGTPQSSTSFPLTVGQGNNTSFNGYVSNLRIVRGTAIYSGSFTVPTSPLTAVTNTKLLTCQSNRFIDNSTNALTLTVTGNTAVQKFSPFSSASPGIVYNQSDITNWSGYFDGTGDFLQTPSNAAFALGTGDYTVECWLYATSAPSDMGIYEGRSTGSSSDGFTLTAFSSSVIRIFAGGVLVSSSGTNYVGQWVHVAVTRASGTTTLWINGVSQGTSATSYNCTNTDAVVGGGRYSAGSSVNTYFPGYISNFRIVKGTAVYTSGFTPPTTNLTAISGTSLLTCQNAAFTDNSTNNFVVTINGNTTVTGNSPFNTVGYWSGYLDGSSYWTVSTSTALDVWDNGAGSFTVEAWIFATASIGNNVSIVAKAPNNGSPSWTPGWAFQVFNGYLNVNTPSDTRLFNSNTTSVPLNQWVHCALVKSGSTVSIYQNGTRVGTTTNSTAYSNTTDAVSIGVDRNFAGTKLTGYVSNVRMVKGTAVYDPTQTTLTVPTSPLTAIANTSLLTVQNGRFIDNSANSYTITLNGTPQAQSFDPFYTSTIASNGGSMYFDGTGDNLSVPSSPGLNFGTSNWTIECWVYVSTRTTNYPLVFGNNRGSFTTDALALTASNSDNASYNDKFVIAWGSAGWTSPSAGTSSLLVANVANVTGTWYHLAIVRESSTSVKMYRNGGQVANATVSSGATFNWGFSGSLLGGGNWDGAQGAFNGYISNLRATPSAVYTAAFTPPTSPVTPSANTTLLVNGMNAGAYDATAINDMETVGSAQVSTVQSKFGGSSFYIPTGCLFIPNSQPLVLGSGNWTVEFWAYTDASGTKVYFDSLNAANTVLQMEIYSSGTSISWVTVGSGVPNITGTGALTANTWQHIAACKSGSSTRLFVNGTQVGSTYTDTATYDTARWEIGSRLSGSFPIVGYLDDLRITNGVARYTANFTAPTAAFPTF